MNQSPSESSSPQRFAAQKAFFESLEDLDHLISESACHKQTANPKMFFSDQSDLDQIEEDLEQALHDLSDQDE